ncbi:MAG: phosphatidylserine/phosphatidylglycerophosphate/cardiolipin synthase family protein, partial [Myxococcales bacterium]|nr:phosphatidylserine/phosphatidylglycerophosphate/cardiolipin synthase family protein [Myxococcales bacterium]
DAVRSVVAGAGLPAGAVLVHPRDELGFRTLDVDFAPLIAVRAARRIRAQGAPLVLVVSDDPRLGDIPASEGFEVWSLGVAAHRSRAPDTLEDVERRARAFVRERDTADADPDRALRRVLDVMTGSRAVAGNAVEMQFHNREARETLFGAIGEAKESIHFQCYMLEEGRFAEHLVVRLIERARRGVPVRLVVDALYSRQDFLGSKNPVVGWLDDEANVEVVASDPVRLEGRGVDAVALKRRDHRKLAVIDGRVAFVSGRNAADPYYTGFDEIAVTDATPHERIPWLDAGVILRGPLVAEVQRVFVDNWHRNGGAPIPEDRTVFPALSRAGRVAARVVSHEGIADANALGAYEALIHAAREHIYIVNDFPVVSVLASAIRQAVARGVRVAFLTGCALARRGDGTFLDGGLHRELFEYMSKRRFEPLLRAGVEAYEYQTPPSPMIVARTGVLRPYVHAKVVTMDGRVASVGSANLDATASYWEREVNVVVEDRGFAERVEREIEVMMARGHRLDLDSEYWKRETAKRAITDTLWPDVFYS